MIEITDISTEYMAKVSLRASEGEVCKVVTNSDFLGTEFLETISLQRTLTSGSIKLYGDDMYESAPDVSARRLRQTGFVWREGGLLSNLKLWENIALPVWYHYGKKAAELEDRVLEIYSMLGREEDDLKRIMVKSPGNLPAYENMYAGLIRTYLMEPDIVFYDAMFEGLSQYFLNKLLDVTKWYHNQKPGRVSVYLSTDVKLLDGLASENITYLKGMYAYKAKKD